MKQPDLGKTLAGIRKSKGLTQDELSGMCNITVRTIQRIESGLVTPRSFTVKIISNALDVDFFVFSEDGYKVKEGVVSLMLRWLEPFIKQVVELFNLKTNTMKKVSILSVILIAIGFGLFALIPNGRAQEPNSIDYSKYTETNSRGITYFFPKGKRISISNVKDTADYKLLGDLIQEYRNRIYLNGNMVGRAFNSDTVIYRNGELIIGSTYWICYSSVSGKEMNYLIPAGTQVDDLSVQYDTTILIIGNDHIREYDYKIFLNEDFYGQVKPGDTIVYNPGVISLIRIDDF